MPLAKISVRFGAAVRTQRQRLEISQERLAEQADLHVTYVSLVERGKRNPTLDVAERLARALNMPLSRLVHECESGSNED